jgi:hypothetical protein
MLYAFHGDDDAMISFVAFDTPIDPSTFDRDQFAPLLDGGDTEHVH